MTIKFLSQYFWPEEMATSELLSGIAFELSKHDYAVSALAGQPAYWKERQKIPAVIEKNGVIIRRVRSTRMDKNASFGRIINSASFALSIFFSSIFHKRAALTLVVTNPPLLIWVARLVKLLRGAHYILIIHDVYPDVAIAIDRMKATSVVANLWRRLNRWAYHGADKIIVLGECMARVLKNDLTPAEQAKVTVIPNWADGEKIIPVSRHDHSLLKKWGLDDKFVVQYSGNIGLFHEIETIVDAADKLRDNAVIHFLVIGAGGNLPWLKTRVAELGLANISFQPFQARQHLPLSLTACDLALVTLKDKATGFCVPSKLYGILAAGKPVLGVVNARSETARVIEEGQCGRMVKPGDSEGLAKTILELSRQVDICKSLGIAARRAYDRHYSLKSIETQYSKMLDSLLS